MNAKDSQLRIGQVAERAGVRVSLIRYYEEIGLLPEPAARRLPEIDALIARAQRVRRWLQDASGCGCARIDDCALFDDVDLPGRREVPALAITHVDGPPA